MEYEEHHRISHFSIFNIAGILSIIFGLLFTFYALAITEIIDIGGFQPRYFALIIWLIFITFLFNPIPTKYHRTRSYIFKSMVKILISPFFPVTLAITYFTNQLLSLITIFEDLVYSFCYYTSLDFANYNASENKCKIVSAKAVFVYALVIFGYILLQSLRAAFDKKKYLY